MLYFYFLCRTGIHALNFHSRQRHKRTHHLFTVDYLKAGATDGDTYYRVKVHGRDSNEYGRVSFCYSEPGIWDLDPLLLLYLS